MEFSVADLLREIGQYGVISENVFQLTVPRSSWDSQQSDDLSRSWVTDFSEVTSQEASQASIGYPPTVESGGFDQSVFPFSNTEEVATLPESSVMPLDRPEGAVDSSTGIVQSVSECLVDSIHRLSLSTSEQQAWTNRGILSLGDASPSVWTSSPTVDTAYGSESSASFPILSSPLHSTTSPGIESLAASPCAEKMPYGTPNTDRSPCSEIVPYMMGIRTSTPKSAARFALSMTNCPSSSSSSGDSPSSREGPAHRLRRSRAHGRTGQKVAKAVRNEEVIRSGQYPCDYPSCEKPFRRHEHLKRHKMTVHGEGTLTACHICRRQFNRTDNLRAHVTRHRTKSGRIYVEGLVWP